MSDVLVKNMEMPTNCFACTFSVLDDYGILVCTRLRKECTRSEVRSDCPLLEVKPHGRLIDADALPIEDEWSLVGTDVVWDAPTVLEAST